MNEMVFEAVLFKIEFVLWQLVYQSKKSFAERH
jgi:hypothetical protein